MNLVPGTVSHPTGHSDLPGGLADVTLWATVANNGNSGVQEEVEVTFYSDEELTQIIGTETVPVPGGDLPSVPGCARREVTVSTVWSDLTPGLHYYWVKVDSGETIEENLPGGGGEADNVGSGFVLIDPEELFMPRMFR